MQKPRVLIKPSSLNTKLLVSYPEEEILRAVLPPARAVHRRAAPSLLEGLSLWLGQPLSVVLYADVEGTSSALGLCDGLGFGDRTVQYEVEVVDPRRRRRGLGTFHDLRQLELRGGR
jgi:hypothetical protein